MRREDSKWYAAGYTKEWWKSLSRSEAASFLASLSAREEEEFLRDWRVWARDDQLAPEWDWDTWLLKPGRGWGKTRTCVETIQSWVEDGWARRIAIVGQGEDDIRTVMIEGESGFLESAPSWNKPIWYPSKGGGALVWPNGCQGFVYSAADTEGLRGPQFHVGWFDEPMAVPRKMRERALDNLEFCLRLGDQARLLISMTPKPDPWVREMEKLAKNPENKIHLTEGSTYDNADNLAANFLSKIKRRYEGTKKGKQEIHGKTLGDEDGTLWPEDTLHKHRMEEADPLAIAAECEKVVVAVDPNTKNQVTGKKGGTKAVAHAAGIVVSGRLKRARYVLADRTTMGGPSKWGMAAVRAAMEFDADEFTVEGNQGGEMCRIVLQQAMDDLDFHIPVHINWSSRGKKARAEPVSTMYAQGLVHHVGPQTELEDLEMQMMYLHEDDDPTGEDYDRCDALVSGLTRLGVKKRASSGSKGRGIGIRTIGEMAHG